MNSTQFFCGHKVRTADIKEIEQTANYEDIEIEQVVKRYCVKDCPHCQGRSFQRQN